MVVSAGEPSGELLLGLLTKELAQQAPDCEVGRLQDEVRLDPVFGFWQGLRAAASVRRSLAQAEGYVVRLKPDLTVLASYSGFHLPLSRRLRRRGLQILYLGPPQVWAWGGWRKRRLRGAADKVVCLFRFEEDLLRRAGVDAVYLGYPLLDSITARPSRAQTLQKLGLGRDEHYVVFLPGSRPAEIVHHRPLFTEVFAMLRRKVGGLRGVMVTAGASPESQVRSPESPSGLVSVSDNRYDVMRHADCACAVSGTVTAELAILSVPMVVCYHLQWLSRVMAQVFVRTPYFALPNILAGKRLVPEVLEPEPEVLARGLELLTRDSDERRQQAEGLARVRAGLGPPGGMARVCQLACQMAARRRP